MHREQNDICVRVRPFGADKIDDKLTWPQDMARAIGIEVTPGFVIDITVPVGCSCADVIEIINSEFPNITSIWNKMCSLDFFPGERAVVQIKKSHIVVGACDRFIISNFENIETYGAFNNFHNSLYMYNDFVDLCEHLKPEFAPIISDIQKILLIKLKKSRIWHLVYSEMRELINEITMAYSIHTETEFPITPIVQLQELIAKHVRLHMKVNNHTGLSSWKFSLAVRRRPLQILPPAIGSGVILLGKGTEHLTKRGSFASSVGFDCFEDGNIKTHSIESMIEQTVHAQSCLEKINTAFASSYNKYYKIGFTLFENNIVVDTIDGVLPSGELVISGNAEQLQCTPDSMSVTNISPSHIRSVLYSRFKSVDNEKPICAGIPAAPGACSGVLATSYESALSSSRAGLPVIFISQSPTPDAMRSLAFSVGAVFQTGGATSHVAVIARGMGKPCIMGIADLAFLSTEAGGVCFSQTAIAEGQWISVDGTNGDIYSGKKDVVRSPMTEKSPLCSVLSYCDKASRMQVYVNADDVAEASIGFEYGARGIGLCRIEHMLLSPKMSDYFIRSVVLGLASINVSSELYRTDLRAMIWKNSESAIRALESCRNYTMANPTYNLYRDTMQRLQKLLKYQIRDLLDVVKDRSVVIRYLDPPLSEFITENLIDKLTCEEFISSTQAESVKRFLRNSKEMMGLRGIRLGLILPELTEMQTLAVYDASCEVTKRVHRTLDVNLMAPLVADPAEFQMLHMLITNCIKKQGETQHLHTNFKIGAMIETPRAAMLAGDIAKTADFISFGTNDLSQFMWAYSRDSADVDFLQYPPYSIISNSPFKVFDIKGVGAIVELAVKQARQAKPLISIGVCGEHAREAKAINFFDKIGVDYVSCVPYAVPEARLLSAHSAITLEQRRSF